MIGPGEGRTSIVPLMASQDSAALEQAGIEFIDNDDMGGYGLRFSKRKRR